MHGGCDAGIPRVPSHLSDCQAGCAAQCVTCSCIYIVMIGRGPHVLSALFICETLFKKLQTFCLQSLNNVNAVAKVCIMGNVRYSIIGHSSCALLNCSCVYALFLYCMVK